MKRSGAAPESEPLADSTARLLRRLEGTTAHTAGKPPGAARSARFDQADLSVAGLRRLVEGSDPAPTWWDAGAERASFPSADLRDCSLRSARLGGLSGDRIDLSGADLASADLHGALLGGGKLDSALLEEADLGGAHLRFASLRNSVLEGARLREADLRGASLSGAHLDRADFRDAQLEEADLRGAIGHEADFRGARLVLTDLRGADLRGADFRGSLFRGARLDGADLRHANLEHADLTSCSIEGIRLSDAKLDRTNLHRVQLGAAVGEELDGDFELARRAYLNLELNFVGLGDPEAASWMYRRRRRAQKVASRRQIGPAIRARHQGRAAGHLGRYVIDKTVELVCDYGESVPRVLLTLAVVFIAFTLWYALGGAVVRELGELGTRAVTRDPLDLLQYSLTAMLAPGGAPEGLYPSGRVSQVIALLQSFVSIFLIGLLGFVAGNRIRR